MLIAWEEILKAIQERGVPITGILHIGACFCEENNDYQRRLGLSTEDVIWVEANEDVAKQSPPGALVLVAAVSDQDGVEVTFRITNNLQSSSILELDLHKLEHPWVVETGSRTLFTKTVDTLRRETEERVKCWSKVNFVNIDIQGAELLALKGSLNLLPQLIYIYLEVNVKHLYKNCALLPEVDEFLKKHGFVRKITTMTRHGWGDALYVRST